MLIGEATTICVCAMMWFSSHHAPLCSLQIVLILAIKGLSLSVSLTSVDWIKKNGPVLVALLIDPLCSSRKYPYSHTGGIVISWGGGGEGSGDSVRPKKENKCTKLH